MLADASDFNVDACSQVAHAISVNEISQEYDYFTAVDDCAADDIPLCGAAVPYGRRKKVQYQIVLFYLQIY